MSRTVPQTQISPRPGDVFVVSAGGRELLHWNGSARNHRPSLFPLIGPSGQSVVRYGHPVDPRESHQVGLWFGHGSLHGLDWWHDAGDVPVSPRIRQDRMVHLQDGDDEAAFAVDLGWYDLHGARLLKQQLTISVRPLPEGELWIELDSMWTPEIEPIEVGRSHFGFCGIRLASSMTAMFGNGTIINSDQATGESAVCGRPARWVDGSGSITEHAIEGVTWFDHPANPSSPVVWQARADGWLGPSFSARQTTRLSKDGPLFLRYALHVHRGWVNCNLADRHWDRYAASTPLRLAAGRKPWQWNLERS